MVPRLGPRQTDRLGPWGKDWGPDRQTDWAHGAQTGAQTDRLGPWGPDWGPDTQTDWGHGAQTGAQTDRLGPYM